MEFDITFFFFIYTHYKRETPWILPSTEVGLPA